MRSHLLVAVMVALFFVACGSDDDGPGAGGTGGVGGTGGDGGTGGGVPSREESCTVIFEAWEACEALAPPTVEDCVADEEMSEERLAGCAECVTAAGCNRLVNEGACEARCGPPKASVVIRGEGFEGGEGKLVYIDVVDGEGVSLLGYSTPLAIEADGTFSQEFPNTFPEGGSAWLLAWSDLDDDAACDSSADRHAKVEIAELRGEVQVLITPDLEDEPSICSSFNVPGHVVLDVTGLDGLDGKTAAVVLVQLYEGGEAVVADATRTVGEGGFSAQFRRWVNRDLDYELRWFVDVDDSMACDATDVGGVHPFAGAPGTTSIEGAPDEDEPSCRGFLGGFFRWGYTVTFGGPGFDAPDETGADGYLINAAGEVLATASGSVVEKVLELHFDKSVPGGFDLELIYFVDIDLDGNCALPADLVGRVTVDPISADGAITIAHEAGDESTCALIHELRGW